MRFISLVIMLVFILAACGGAPTGQNAEEGDSDTGISLAISGAVDYQTNAASGVYTELDRSNFQSYMIEVGSPADGYLARIVYSGNAESGTYPISAEMGTERTEENVFTAGLVYLYQPDGERQYRMNPQGTITLEFADGFLSGSFEFTATSESGNNTVNVQGTMKNIRLTEGQHEF